MYCLRDVNKQRKNSVIDGYFNKYYLSRSHVYLIDFVVHLKISYTQDVHKEHNITT